MKRLLVLFIVLAVLVCSSSAWAVASTMTFTKVEAYTPTGKWIKITAVCTADSLAATWTDVVIPYDITGRYLYSVSTYFGATAPTADTDLTLTAGSATGEDILHGAGVDRIDAVTNNSFKPYIDAAASPMPIYENLYINIDNNAVNSAVVTIVFRFIQ